MKNFASIKARFLKDPFNIKIGNLTANLARLSTFSENSKNKKVLEDILEESKFFIEWTASEAPLEIQTLLSNIQPKLALWQHRLLQQKEGAAEIEELKEMTKYWSAFLMEFSGLLSNKP